MKEAPLNILEPISWREFQCRDKYGCSLAEFMEISSFDNAVRGFMDQRAKARRRGIEFNLTLFEWWGIWQQSGLWSQRGRCGEQYAMCRNGDVGPYEVGNVYIATQIQNLKDRHKFRAANRAEPAVLA